MSHQASMVFCRISSSRKQQIIRCITVLLRHDVSCFLKLCASFCIAVAEGHHGWSFCLPPTYILGDITDKRFRLLRSMLPFRGLSVCLSVTFPWALCSNDRRYRHDFSCIRHNSPMSLLLSSHRSRVYPFLPKFCSKSYPR